MLCIFCETKLTSDTAPEHILLNALGGRKTSRTVICSKCNNDFGTTTDETLAKQFEGIRNLMNFQSGTSKSAPMLRKVQTTEEKVTVYGDGRIELAEKPFTITKLESGQFDVRIHADKSKWAEYIPHIAQKIGLPEAELKRQLMAATPTETSKRPGWINLSLSFGGEGVLRSVTKTFLELWCLATNNDEVRSDFFSKARIFAKTGASDFYITKAHSDYRFIPPRDVIKKKYGPFFNLIYVRSDATGRVVGHFTIYNLIGFQVELCEQGATPNLSCGLVADPLNPSEWSDKIADEIEISFDWLTAELTSDGRTEMKQRLSAMLEFYQKAGTSRELDSIIKEAWERHKLPKDKPPTPEQIKAFSREVSERAAAHLLHLPLERAIPAEELARMMEKKKK